MNEVLIDIKQLAKRYKDSDFFAVQPLDLSISKKEMIEIL